MVGAIAAASSFFAVSNASADYIEPALVPDAPQGQGMGHVSVSTGPGHTIIVDIVGRTDALGVTGPLSGGCNVVVGQHVLDNFVTLDETGSGTVTMDVSNWIDPSLGYEYVALTGECGSHGPTPTELFALHEPACPDCARDGYAIHFDGGLPVIGPKYPKPAPINQQPADTSCSDDMRQTMDRYGMSADIADLGLALAKAPQANLAQKAFAACALTADDPQEAFTSLCNVGRSMIPADWAYLAIEQLGQNISNDQIENFGRSTSEAWNAQCR